MRISDWSSDVCSSDLTETFRTAINDAASLTQFLLESLIKQVNLGSLEGRARLIALARPHVDKLPAGALRTLLIDELGRRARLGRDDIEVMLGAPKATATGAMQVSAVATHAAGTSRPVRRALQLLLERPTLAARVAPVARLAQRT